MVFARTGATVGKSFLIKGKIPEAVFASYLIRVILSSQIRREYVYYFFQSPKYWLQIYEEQIGIGQPNVNSRKLSKLSIPLPPFPEQSRIVVKVEELFSRLDAGVDSLKSIKVQLRRYRQAVLKHAFEGKLTEEWRRTNRHLIEPASLLLQRIRKERKERNKGKYRELPTLDTSDLPESWAWTRLDNIGIVASGSTPSTKEPEFWGGRIPWLTPADLTNYEGKFIGKGARNITKKGLDACSARLLPEGTILFSSRAPVGYTVIATNPITTNQGFKNLIVSESIFNEYVYHYLKGNKQLAERYASGTTFKELSATRFRRIPIPIPPYLEQQQIVGAIEQYFSVADKAMKIVGQSLLQSERLRQSILKTAFEGKLVAQDPTEEPAEKLLKRIREEKEKRDNEKKKTKSRKKSEWKQLEVSGYVT